MTEQKRINIISISRQLYDQGYTGQHSLAPVGNEFTYDQIKPELYALLSIAVDNIVENSYNRRVLLPPYGLLIKDENEPSLRAVSEDDINPIAPFQSIAKLMSATLVADIKTELSDFMADRLPPKLTSVYDRINFVAEDLYNRRLAPSRERYRYGAEGLLSSGTAFAAEFMSGILEVLPKVVPEGESPQELVQIARNSYPIVLQFAAGNFDVTVSTAFFMSKGELGERFEFSPYLFYLNGFGSKRRIETSPSLKALLENGGIHEALKTLENGGIPQRKRDLSPTIGCPALINFGQGSAIQKLWDWHVEIAEKIYPKLVEVQ